MNTDKLYLYVHPEYSCYVLILVTDKFYDSRNVCAWLTDTIGEYYIGKDYTSWGNSEEGDQEESKYYLETESFRGDYGFDSNCTASYEGKNAVAIFFSNLSDAKEALRRAKDKRFKEDENCKFLSLNVLESYIINYNVERTLKEVEL